MEFKIIIKKWAVFYFFVQNLSEWHFSNRKYYNTMWRKETKLFTHELEKALKLFKKIHKNHSFGKNYLGHYFFLRKNPLEDLKDKLHKKDFNDIKGIFSLFEEEFKIFYKRELPLLKRWKNNLEKKINNPKIIKSILKTLNALYNTNIQSKKVKIYLLPSSPKAAGGGASVGKNEISLECSRLSLSQINRVIAIIWHEMVHCLFEKEYFFPLIKTEFLQDRNAVNLIKETTASSLFPNGILGKKFLKTKGESLNRKLPNKYNKPILKLTELYMKRNKIFDEHYIDKLYSITSKLKGILR